uniref:Uncharacterized protein n=1 Tax=Pararge aegeria TaxID=116150 RepID=S4NRT1_9NEOP
MFGLKQYKKMNCLVGLVVGMFDCGLQDPRSISARQIMSCIEFLGFYQSTLSTGVQKLAISTFVPRRAICSLKSANTWISLENKALNPFFL